MQMHAVKLVTEINPDNLKEVLQGFREALCMILNSSEKTREESKQQIENIFQKYIVPANHNDTKIKVTEHE